MKKANSREYVRVKRRLIVAQEEGAGFTWTLAAALGEMLSFAEEQFGLRDRNYTLLGIDFSPSGGRTWSPGNFGHIIIHLSMDCLRDRQAAYLQLAHESIHLLSPTGMADANVLEEGIAVHFAEWYMHTTFGEEWWSGQITIPAYANALAQTRQLLALDSEIIKKLRSKQPVISRITAEQILAHCPEAPEELCQALAERVVPASVFSKAKKET